MKKIFTLIAVAAMAVGANAQDEKLIISWNEAPELTSLTTDEMTNTGTSNNVATWADGTSIMIMRSDKAQSSGSNITIDGTTYKSIKVSNGAQNKLTMPEGKKAYKLEIYSYVNIDAENRNVYWAEVNGNTYEFDENNKMTSYKDGENPDLRTFELGGVDSFTFKNAGEQLCYVLVISLTGNTDGITNVKAAAADAAIYNLAGQKVGKDYKGVVIQNGKKFVVK